MEIQHQFDELSDKQKVKSLVTEIQNLYILLKESTKESKASYSSARQLSDDLAIRQISVFTLIEYVRAAIEILLEGNSNRQTLNTGTIANLAVDIGLSQSGHQQNVRHAQSQQSVTSSTVSQQGCPDVYESMIVKLEEEVRKHIRIEQMLKLHIESMEDACEQLENDYNIQNNQLELLQKQVQKLESVNKTQKNDLTKSNNLLARIENDAQQLRNELSSVRKSNKHGSTNTQSTQTEFKQKPVLTKQTHSQNRKTPDSTSKARDALNIYQLSSVDMTAPKAVSPTTLQKLKHFAVNNNKSNSSMSRKRKSPLGIQKQSGLPQNQFNSTTQQIISELQKGLNTTNNSNSHTENSVDRRSDVPINERKKLKSRQMPKSIQSEVTRGPENSSPLKLKIKFPAQPSNPILNYPNIINNNIQGLHINYSNHITQVPHTGHSSSTSVKEKEIAQYRRCRSQSPQHISQQSEQKQVNGPKRIQSNHQIVETFENQGSKRNSRQSNISKSQQKSHQMSNRSRNFKVTLGSKSTTQQQPKLNTSTIGNKNQNNAYQTAQNLFINSSQMLRSYQSIPTLQSQKFSSSHQVSKGQTENSARSILQEQSSLTQLHQMPKPKKTQQNKILVAKNGFVANPLALDRSFEVNFTAAQTLMKASSPLKQ